MSQVKQELERRKSQTVRILDRIKQGDATNADLARIGTRYTERVRELRKEGKIIIATYEKPGLWRYTYKGDRDEIVRRNGSRLSKEYEDTY